MDAFYLSGAATVTAIVLCVAAVIALLSAFGMRDQPTLKGPVMLVLLTAVFAGGAWFVHQETGAAQDAAYAHRWKVLKTKYGVKVKATAEVTDLEASGRWRVGNQYRPCYLVESSLTVADPVVMCEEADGRFQELPTVADQ